MDEIIGFDEQIGRMPIRSTMRNVLNKAKQQSTSRPMQIRKKSVPVPSGSGMFAKLKQLSQTRPAQTRPAQIRKKSVPVPSGSTAAQKRTIQTIRRSVAQQKAVPKSMLIKPSGKITPVRIKRTTNPAVVRKLNPIARSFMPVDLPYQATTSSVSKMNLKNTPISLPVSIDMIVPAVDAGVQNYYGK